MSQILICTHNQGKFIEISTLLKDLNAELVSLDQAGIDFDVEETGQTYEENAILKAKTYGEKAVMIAIGDDTGLEIETLNGAPGVHSKRYFKTSGEERNKELLKLLENKTNRNAKFVASVAVFNPKTGDIKTFLGEALGQIIENPKGEAHKDLGYDSVFYSNDLKKTFAQISPEEKNEFSHRGRAVKSSISYLSKLL